VEQRTTPDRLDLRDLQQQLKRLGIPFHIADVKEVDR
jgi:hypothetical protein